MSHEVAKMKARFEAARSVAEYTTLRNKNLKPKRAKVFDPDKPYHYKYPRAALTVDAVVFAIDPQARLNVLLIQRKHDPFKGQWALPGGFKEVGESLDDAVARELREETNLDGLFLEQLYTFSEPGRDPREDVVSVAYWGLVRAEDWPPKRGSDAKEAAWFRVDQMPVELAFDHLEIFKVAIQRLRAKIRYQPVGFELLEEEFTMARLRTMYGSILGRELDPANFRRKFLSFGLLVPVDKAASRTKPATLYRFDVTRYEELVREGFQFELGMKL